MFRLLPDMIHDDFVKQYMTILLKNIMATGLWIAFGITGIIVLVVLAALALFVTRMRSAPSVQHGTQYPKAFVHFYGTETPISLSNVTPSTIQNLIHLH